MSVVSGIQSKEWPNINAILLFFEFQTIPVICSKEIQRSIQLYNVRPKQHIVSDSEVQAIDLMYDRPGTQ